MPTFAIGDIHGCFTALKAIFNEDWVQPGDLIVFLGDYIDRGEDSKAVIDWLLENRAHYHFEFILGNHELMMQTASEKPQTLTAWLQNGGSETLDSYGIGDDLDWFIKIPHSHWNFIKMCKSYLKIGNTVFVHAGLDPNKPLEKQNEDDLFWRKYLKPRAYNSEIRVICGHTSRKNGEIANFDHTVCIDTYCYGGQWLTCLNIDNNSFLKANNKGEVVYGKL